MLCVHGTSHGPVSVCLCPSVTSRSSTIKAKRKITQTTPHDSPGTSSFVYLIIINTDHVNIWYVRYRPPLACEIWSWSTKGWHSGPSNIFYKICQNCGGLAHLLPLDSKKEKHSRWNLARKQISLLSYAKYGPDCQLGKGGTGPQKFTFSSKKLPFSGFSSNMVIVYTSHQSS